MFESATTAKASSKNPADPQGAFNLFLLAARFTTDKTNAELRYNGIEAVMNVAARHPKTIAPLAVQLLRTIAKTEPVDKVQNFALSHIETCQLIARRIKSGPEIKRAPSLKRQDKSIKRFIDVTERRAGTLMKRYTRRALTQPK